MQKYASLAPPSGKSDEIRLISSYGNRIVPVAYDEGYWKIIGSEATARTETQLLRKGVVGSPTVDDSSALQEALLSLVTAGKRTAIVFPPGMDIRINNQIEIVLPLASYDFNNTRLRCDQMTKGNAILAKGQSIDPHNRFSASCALEGLILDLPLTDVPVGGIRFGDGALIVGQSPVRDITIVGGLNQIEFNSHSYIQQFDNVHLLNARQHAMTWVGDVNTGESTLFHGGEMSKAWSLDPNNPAIALFIPEMRPNGPTLNLDGTSCDYNQIGFRILSGMVNWYMGNFENMSMLPQGTCRYRGGKASTMVNLRDCTVVHGTLGKGYEDPLGRPIMFAIDDDSDDRCSMNITGTRYMGYGKTNTEFAHFDGEDPNCKLVVDQHHIEQKGNAIGRISGKTNILPPLANWVKEGDARYCEFAVVPGKTMVFRVLAGAGVTVSPRVIMQDCFSNELDQKNFSSDQVTGCAAMVYDVVPGAMYARVQVPDALIGKLLQAEAWLV